MSGRPVTGDPCPAVAVPRRKPAGLGSGCPQVTSPPGCGRGCGRPWVTSLLRCGCGFDRGHGHPQAASPPGCGRGRGHPWVGSPPAVGHHLLDHLWHGDLGVLLERVHHQPVAPDVIHTLEAGGWGRFRAAATTPGPTAAAPRERLSGPARCGVLALEHRLAGVVSHSLPSLPSEPNSDPGDLLETRLPGPSRPRLRSRDEADLSGLSANGGARPGRSADDLWGLA